MSNQVNSFDFGPLRHKDNPSIILTDRMAVFKAAAHHESCQAAILKIDEEKKAADRQIFQKFLEQFPSKKQNISTDKTGCEIAGSLYDARFGEEKLKNLSDCSIEHIQPHIFEMSRLYCEIEDAMRVQTILVSQWREAERTHDPHSDGVLNRVFFSGGTILETNTGYFQNEEGDLLYLSAGCPHYPEDITYKNVDQDRLTVASIKYG